jgi:hypothetical protein
VLDFGGVRYGVDKVTTLSGDDETVIIEAGNYGLTVAGLKVALLNTGSKYARVELFVTSGDDYGYWDVGQFLMLSGSVRITAGSFISGGV